MEKILIIDDDIQLSKLIDEFLVTFNYESTILHEPEPALKFLEKNQIDLVILDIMLPGMDGFQVLRQIREHSQSHRLRRQWPLEFPRRNDPHRQR